MAESVFDRLLESYSGLRKRTWTPVIIIESGLPRGIWPQLFGQKGAEGMSKEEYVNILHHIRDEVVKAPSSTKIIPDQQAAEEIQKAPIGTVIVSSKDGSSPPSTIFLRGFKTFSPLSINSIEKILGIIDQFIAAAQDVDDDTNQDELERASQQPSVVFSETQRSTIAKNLSRVSGLEGDKVESIISKWEATIATPRSNTRLGKSLQLLLEKENPDLSQEVQQQLLTLISSIFSLANKVEKITLKDGTKVRVIRSNKLTYEERQASSVVTIRNNGKVHFGRFDVSKSDLFGALQDFVREFDGGTYGVHMGKAFDKYASQLKGVVVVPDSFNPYTLTEKDLNDFDTIVKESKSASTKAIQSDARGKFAEDVFQLSFALLSKNKDSIAQAKSNLVKRIKVLSSLGEQDAEFLETALLADESDEFDSVLSLLEETPSLNGAVKHALLQISKRISIFKDVIGLKDSDIAWVDRPSSDSVIGSRADIIVKLKPNASVDFSNISKTTNNFQVEEDGSVAISISLKELTQDTGTTVLGSASLLKGYMKTSEEFKTLQEEVFSQAIPQGAATEEDFENCVEAAEWDHGQLKALTKLFGSITNPNITILKSYIVKQKKKLVSYGATNPTTAKKLSDLLDSLKANLESNPRNAVAKMFQLRRVARALRDKKYAQAIAINDAILSMATYDSEVIVRGSPSEITLGTTTDVMNSLIKGVFSGEFTTSILPGASSIKDKETGSVIFSTRIAGKDKKLIAEAKLAEAGRRKLLTIIKT